MDKLWAIEAWEEFEKWLFQDRKTLKRILMLLKDIERGGYYGLGKPEPLKGNLAGYWSRRIDDKNRIVYKIKQNMIIITACGSHYQDK